MLRVRAMSCCWPLATLHLLAEGQDHCVIHGQRTAFFVTFEVNDILILIPGEEGRPFSLPPKKIIIIKARKCRKFPSVTILNEKSEMNQIDKRMWFSYSFWSLGGNLGVAAPGHQGAPQGDHREERGSCSECL